MLSNFTFLQQPKKCRDKKSNRPLAKELPNPNRSQWKTLYLVIVVAPLALDVDLKTS